MAVWATAKCEMRKRQGSECVRASERARVSEWVRKERWERDRERERGEGEERVGECVCNIYNIFRVCSVILVAIVDIYAQANHRSNGGQERRDDMKTYCWKWNPGRKLSQIADICDCSHSCPSNTDQIDLLQVNWLIVNVGKLNLIIHIKWNRHITTYRMPIILLVLSWFAYIVRPPCLELAGNVRPGRSTLPHVHNFSNDDRSVFFNPIQIIFVGDCIVLLSMPGNGAEHFGWDGRGAAWDYAVFPERNVKVWHCSKRVHWSIDFSWKHRWTRWSACTHGVPVVSTVFSSAGCC